MWVLSQYNSSAPPFLLKYLYIRSSSTHQTFTLGRASGICELMQDMMVHRERREVYKHKLRTLYAYLRSRWVALTVLPRLLARYLDRTVNIIFAHYAIWFSNDYRSTPGRWFTHSRIDQDPPLLYAAKRPGLLPSQCRTKSCHPSYLSLAGEAVTLPVAC